MKAFWFNFVFLTLFYALLSVNPGAAQETYGAIKGSVTNEQGAVPNAEVVIKQKGSNRPPETATTDDQGNFIVRNLRKGTYEIAAKSNCMTSKIEDVEIVSDQPLNVNLSLVFEDCEKKASEEAAEWEACERETAIPGLEAVGFDKAAAVNQILEDTWNYENGDYMPRPDEIILSTENIKAEWLKPFSNLKINLLSPPQIQARAEKSKDGIAGYYKFAPWRSSHSCAFAGLSVDIAVSKKSTVGLCGNSNYIIYLYRKKGDRWEKVAKKGFI